MPRRLFRSLTRPAGAEAKAEIHGPRDLYVKMGSLVTLACKVSQGPHELGTIHWYRGECGVRTGRTGENMQSTLCGRASSVEGYRRLYPLVRSFVPFN